MGGGGDSMDAISKAIQRIKTAKMEAKTAELEAKLEAMTQELAKRGSGKKTEELLTSKEIAPYLGVTHPKTIERWVREKGLPCVRIGRNLRFRLGDVLLWLAQRKES
jgi:excisionase family DNA binding protein